MILLIGACVDGIREVKALAGFGPGRSVDMLRLHLDCEVGLVRVIETVDGEGTPIQLCMVEGDELGRNVVLSGEDMLPAVAFALSLEETDDPNKTH